MRINSIPPKDLLNSYVHVREKAAVTKQTRTDKVELTSDAKTFSAALSAAKEAMGTRTPEQTAHVNNVAQQVKTGTYSVPGNSVAEKILGK